MPIKMIRASAIALVLTPVPSVYANPFAADQVMLRTADIDLGTAKGVKAMNTRIANAAVKLCGDSLTPLGQPAVQKGKSCRTEMIAEMQQRVGLVPYSTSLAMAQ